MVVDGSSCRVLREKVELASNAGGCLSGTRGRIGNRTTNYKIRHPEAETGQPWMRGKMAAEKSQNLQDTFLNHVRKNKLPLTIFLVNGVKLQGVITWFDNFCVLLRRDGLSQLVYKHAISTVMPGQPVRLFEGDEEEGTES